MGRLKCKFPQLLYIAGTSQNQIWPQNRGIGSMHRYMCIDICSNYLRKVYRGVTNILFHVEHIIPPIMLVLLHSI